MMELPISQSANDSLAELKHSVYMHVTLQGGPSPQLSVFLVKVLDLVDDFYVALDNEKEREQRLARIEQECASLSFHIIESLALWLQKAFDERKGKAENRGDIFPSSVSMHGDNLLVLIGKSRNLPDKKIAKNAVLRGIAEALRALQSYTKSSYPEIRDVKNNLL
jgi:hypothetical protein